MEMIAWSKWRHKERANKTKNEQAKKPKKPSQRRNRSSKQTAKKQKTVRNCKQANIQEER